MIIIIIIIACRFLHNNSLFNNNYNVADNNS